MRNNLSKARTVDYSHLNKGRPARPERRPGVFKKIEPPVRRAHPIIHAMTEVQNRLEIPTPELARRSGVDVGTIRGWRVGKSHGHIAHVEACLNVLGLRLDVARLEDKP